MISLHSVHQNRQLNIVDLMRYLKNYLYKFVLKPAIFLIRNWFEMIFYPLFWNCDDFAMPFDWLLKICMYLNSSNSKMWKKYGNIALYKNVSAQKTNNNNNYNQIDRILSTYISLNARFEIFSFSLSLFAFLVLWIFTKKTEICFFPLVRIIIYSDSFEGSTINAS